MSMNCKDLILGAVGQLCINALYRTLTSFGCSYKTGFYERVSSKEQLYNCISFPLKKPLFKRICSFVKKIQFLIIKIPLL